MRAFRAFGFCTSMIACWVACEEVRAQQQSADTTGDQFVAAQQQSAGTTANQLVAPELILQYKEQLKLSPGQQNAVQALMDSAKLKLPALQKQHNTEIQALRDKIQYSVSDEEAVLSQLDKVIILERNIRRLQLSLVIRVYNQLNAQQQADLEKVKVDVVNQRRALQERLQSKLQRAQQLVQQRTKAGSSPNDVVVMMKPFNQLLKEGKIQQAESLLDQAIARLAPADVSDPISDSDLFPK